MTQQTHGRIKRVVISAAAVVALFAGYCAADVTDLVPGVLTVSDVKTPTFADPATVTSGDSVVESLDVSKTLDATKARAAIDTLLAAEGVGSDVSVIIEDAQGNVAAEHNGATPREPASTMKTLTALAASSTLDMGATLDTQVFFTQSDKGNVLVLKGNGDMLLSAGKSDTSHVNGRAGLATLAESTAKALTKRGVKSVSFAYDDSLFGTNRTPSRISENNGEFLYYTPISSMAIDGGRQRQALPENPDDCDDYPVLSQATAQDAAETFVSLLKSNGITVNGDVTTGTAPSDSEPIASVKSAT